MSILLLLLLAAAPPHAEELFDVSTDKQTRWYSFENPTAAKGEGGQENRGAKGHAFDTLPAGKTVTLMQDEGSGTIRRIWMTFDDRSQEMLRSLRLDMYWDSASRPAVSVPVGDFFGVALGRKVPFESVFFADPEGRSFNCFIPMPYRSGARITLTNESRKDLRALFYDVNVTIEKHDPQLFYFHAYWNRDPATTLGEDFEVLPRITGRGRFLGTNIGLVTPPVYDGTWWGEGEIKIYLDGDSEFPTLVGTGTEDYVGTAYGQGEYSHRYQGSPVVDDKAGEYAFYRYHVPDPVYFSDDIRVTIQQIGGAPKERVVEMMNANAELIPVSVAGEKFLKLLEKPVGLNSVVGWVNFYRRDDVSSTAYFYLDRPESGLPALAPVNQRTQ
jgi:hypothetical protein